MNSDTIFAIATGPGRAAVAVVRLSGPAAAAALTALGGPLPPPRAATLRPLRDPADGRVLDRAMVLWFPEPASFTGEDCSELHLHGSRAVLDAVLGALAALPGCRLATAGEFTRRAYLNGKMDLAAVEGLADLIDAQTEAQRRQALRQLDGALGAWVAVQRARLLRALAAAESAIDFADEGDVAGDLEAEVLQLVGVLQDALAAELERSARAARVREGLVIVLAGAPNAGKSTLLNALARREVAIVSPQPGTTRDLIEVQLDLDGCLVTVVDTAGLRHADDPVEREGVTRARARAASADLVLWLADAREQPPPAPPPIANRIWRVATKLDLAPEGRPADADFALAVPSGAGLPDLIQAMTAFAATDRTSAESAVTTRLRHRRALLDAQAALATIPAAGENGLGLELVAEQLRRAVRDLDSLVGRIEPEEILGEIFARFCIGK